MTPGYEHVAFWREEGLGDHVSDPVHVDACTDEWVKFAVGEYEEWSSRDEVDREEWPFAYAIAPDALHKDNISGGAPIAIVPGDFGALRLPTLSTHDLLPLIVRTPGHP